MHKSYLQQSLLKISVLALPAFIVGACQKQGEPKNPDDLLQTMHQQVTYINSYKMIAKGAANGVEFDPVVMARAVYDAKNGLPPMIPKEDQEATMMQHHKEYIAAKEKAAEERGEINKKEGAAYLANFAQQEGVMVTDSGLQYRVLKAVDSDAPKPTKEDRVKAHYKGMLIDGTVFRDTSVKGKPEIFPIATMIPGWVEGIPLMKVGEKFEFTVPADLAYGEKGTKGIIGRNQVLRFEFELLEIEPKKEKR